MINKYFLSAINIYPIKSLGGISLQSSLIEERGLGFDRRWMLVDDAKRFITQRSNPQMALFNVKLENELLIINHKQNKLSPLTIRLQPYEEELINVQVWKDSVIALKYGGDVNDWFSKALGIKCKLVYMPDTTKRKVDPKYANNKIVSFADGYQFLIIGEESLNDLNNKLKMPLSMNRFRPNLVFSGGEAFDEDRWKQFKIGKMGFRAVKPCSRCVITTINQDTGIKSKEPLTTLSTYRGKNGKVLFGMNMVAEGTGKINVSDEIKINVIK